MIQRTQSLSEMSERAVRMLVRELGVVETLRFLNQFRVGNGDYTKDRDALFAQQSVPELAEQIKQWRAANPRPTSG
ncbi:MAG TPA: hypothetical protein VFV87_01930 [Pirellulaceae bacterium]|nr:hypothetical protein [Pirellulaceae bacterium]